MGNCESPLSRPRRQRRERTSPKSSNKTIPHCALIDNAYTGKIDLGYSFINMELSAREVLTSIPPQKRILVQVGNKIICFDSVELYAWLKTNPKANLEGPFGSFFLTKEQKKLIISIAEKNLPSEDLIEQKKQFDWNLQTSDLERVEKHLSSSQINENKSDDQDDSDESYPAKKESTISPTSILPIQDIFTIIYDSIISDSIDFVDDEKVKAAVDSMIIADREQAALQLVDVFAAHDIHIPLNDRREILNRCIHNQSFGVMGALIRNGQWCKDFSESALTSMIIVTIDSGKESVFRFFLTLLEEIQSLPQSDHHKDMIYEKLYLGQLPTKWFEILLKTLGLAPSITILSACTINDTATEGMKWIMTKCDIRNENELKSVIKHMLCNEKYNCIRIIIDKFSSLLSPVFIGDILAICNDKC